MKPLQVIRKTAALLIAAAMTLSGVNSIFVREVKAAVGTTYYVSNTSGSDTNAGISSGAPWQTLSKVNSMTFMPGDKILFDNQSIWTGQLAPKGSGLAGSPIVIDMYGSGTGKPIIQGNGLIVGADTAADKSNPQNHNTAVFFYNQSYWEINNLEVTNTSTATATYQTYSGSTVITRTDVMPSKDAMLFMAKDSGIIRHIYIRNCNILDVNADPDFNRGAGIGRGGIVFSIRGKTIPTKWDDIVVEDNKIGPRITHYGVGFVSTWVGMYFSSESGIPDNERGASTLYSSNIVMRNNYCKDVGNAAIFPSGYENAVVENNVIDICNSGKNGNVPIWWQFGKDIKVQYNEVFGTGASGVKEDSQAFDGDLNAGTSYVQYNYTHDNPSGSYFECAIWSPYITHFRYNISVNDGSGTNSHGGGSVVTTAGAEKGKLYVYNNDILIGPGQLGFIANSWDPTTDPTNYTFTNNLIYSDGNSRGWEPRAKAGSTMINNYYGGSNVSAILRTDDATAVTGGTLDMPGLIPALTKTMAQATGWANTNDYKRGTTSVLKNAGTPIAENGGLDIYGNFVSPFGAPSIGVHEISAINTIPANTVYLDFEAPTTLTTPYAGVTFSSADFQLRSGATKEMFISTTTVDTPQEKIIVPKDMYLYGFTARTDSTARVDVTWKGITKTFYPSSVKGAFITGFTEGSGGSDPMHISVSDANGASKVSFDNFIFKKSDTSIIQNIALNKTATANRGANIANAVDGVANTYAGDVAPGTPFVITVDLLDVYHISKFEVAWEDIFTDMGAHTGNILEDWKYKIQYSSDNVTWTDACDYSVTNPFTDLPTSPLQVTDRTSTPINARYIRLNVTDIPSQGSSNDWWYSVGDFRAYGIKLSDLVTNVALNKPSSQNAGGNPAAYANDGTIATLGGSTDPYYNPLVWTVNLGQDYLINKTEMVFEDKGFAPFKGDWKYKIEYSTDAAPTTWITAVDYTTATGTTNTNTTYTQTVNFPSDITARQFKVTVNGRPPNWGTAWYAIAEFRAFGKLPPGAAVDEGLDLLSIAYGKPVITNTEIVPNPAWNVTDGLKTTSWTSASATDFLQIDLGMVYDINQMKIDFGTSTAHKFKISTSMDKETWITYYDCSAGSAAEASIPYTYPAQARYIKYEALESGQKVVLVKAYGNVAPAAQKTVLVVAPHPDDEALLGGGIIKRAVDRGDKVYVVVATNGDYSSLTSGKNRMNETLKAMAKLGVPQANILFMSFPDLGGFLQGGGQQFTDSVFYKTFNAEPTAAFTSRYGGTLSYGGTSNSYYMNTFGAEVTFTRENFLKGLQTAINTINPTDVYTTSRFDLHADHAYVGLFTNEAIVNIKKANITFDPTMHEAVIHSCAGDNAWPIKNSDAAGIIAMTRPANLESRTSFDWNKRISITVPEAMRYTPFSQNLKDQVLRTYGSQYYDYIGSFAKYDEIFWDRDYKSLSYLATATASTNPATAVKAIDGIADGYSTSLIAAGIADHNRFPHAEWVSGGTVSEWVKLEWDMTYGIGFVTIDKIVLNDRPDTTQNITSGTLTFSDGTTETTMPVGALPKDGRPLEIKLPTPTKVRWVKFTADAVEGTAAGLAEFEVFGIGEPSVKTITVGPAATTAINTNQTLQMTAEVLPEEAANREVTWTVTSVDGITATTLAAIDATTGLLTPVATKPGSAPFAPGVVRVTATAKDGSGVFGFKDITINPLAVISITVTAQSLTAPYAIYLGEQVQMLATPLAADAYDKSVTWSISNVDGTPSTIATIDATTGVLTSTGTNFEGLGVVRVTATAKDGSAVFGFADVEIKPILVSAITVTALSSSILDKETLQMSAAILPLNATDQTYTWSVVDAGGNPSTIATIDTIGLLTSTGTGDVVVKATANDTGHVVGQMVVSIKPVLITGIEITNVDGIYEVVEGNTLPLTATISIPATATDATDSTYTWSVVNGTGSATIDANGVLTGVAPGMVTVKVTANDASGIFAEKIIEITSKPIPVTSIEIVGAVQVNEASTSTYTAVVMPATATNKAVVWSVVNGTGTATIDASGVLTAIIAGRVTVVATAADESGVVVSKEVEIVVPVVSIKVTGTAEVEVGKESTYAADILPANATNKSVAWSVVGVDGGAATINSSGVLTGVTAGKVKVIATAADGSGVVGEIEVTITTPVVAPPVLVSGITISGSDSVKMGEAPAYKADVFPVNADNTVVIWSIVPVDGEATVSSDGTLTPLKAGTVKLIATAADGSGVVAEKVVTINESIVIPPIDKDPILVTAITIDGASEVKVNAMISLIASVSPTNAEDKRVVWSIRDDIGIAAIDNNGNLTAYAAGTITVIAEAADNSGIIAAKTISILPLPVEPIPTPVQPGGSNHSSEPRGEITKPTVPVEEKVIKLIVDKAHDVTLRGGLCFDYVHGYEDGTVKPDGTITRAEFSTMLYNLTMNKDKFDTAELESKFNDVNDAQWFAKSIKYFASKGVLKGYGNREFRPNGKLTRAELASVLANFADVKVDKQTVTLSDTKGHWAEKSINLLVANGAISGYPDGTFKPDAFITRAETITLMNKILQREHTTNTHKPENVHFKDLDQSHWAYSQILCATDEVN